MIKLGERERETVCQFNNCNDQFYDFRSIFFINLAEYKSFQIASKQIKSYLFHNTRNYNYESTEQCYERDITRILELHNALLKHLY